MRDFRVITPEYTFLDGDRAVVDSDDVMVAWIDVDGPNAGRVYQHPTVFPAFETLHPVELASLLAALATLTLECGVALRLAGAR